MPTKIPLFAFEPGIKIRREGQALRVYQEKKKTKPASFTVPSRILKSICMVGYNEITAPALHLCWHNNIPVSFLSHQGRFLARLTGFNDTSVETRLRQYAANLNKHYALTLAHTFIRAKILNMCVFIRQALKRAGFNKSLYHKLESFRTLMLAVSQIENASAKAQGIQRLLGIEGIASKSYFALLRSTIREQRKPHFDFLSRTRRPPKDMFNALLSFLYTLLLADCCAALQHVGLDTGIGFLHVSQNGRPALALDLMEELRPWVVDRLVIRVAKESKIQL